MSVLRKQRRAWVSVISEDGEQLQLDCYSNSPDASFGPVIDKSKTKNNYAVFLMIMMILSEKMYEVL